MPTYQARNKERPVQYYKGIPLQLIARNYQGYKARRYNVNYTNQNVWIPCKHLDGTNIIPGEDIDYVFAKSWKQCMYAGVCTGFNDLVSKLRKGVVL